MTDQYIITEEQLKKLLSLQIKDWVGVAEEIRSHPYNPQFTQDELSDLFIIVDADIDRNGKDTKTMKLLNKIEELRQGKREQP